jgi:hypothetical protein
MVAVIFPVVVGFILNECAHRRRDRSAGAAALAAEHRRRQVEVLEELREVVLVYGDVASAHLWAGWSQISGCTSDDEAADLDTLHDEQERLALRLFSVCAAVDDPWIRHRVDYLEERARWSVVEPGKQYLAGGASSTSVDVVLGDDQDLKGRVILINNLIGERIMALTGGRRLPEWPEEMPTASSSRTALKRRPIRSDLS